MMNVIRSARYLFFTLLLAPLVQPALGQSAPEKSSPFTAVRWEGEVPLVRFEGTWYGFVALDGLSKDAILAHAKEAYGRRWQKRFSEDLVELLQGMGHTPGVTVQLQLNQEGNTIEVQGTMTEENRNSVRDYNQEPEDAMEQAVVEARTASTHPSEVEADGNESTAAQAWARQYAAHIDVIWDQSPEEGLANLKFLVQRNDEPLAGKTALQTEFTFQAAGPRGQQISQGFNPNGNGRWVYEGLKPGTYTLTINGLGRFEEWTWEQTITASAGEVLMFQLDLEH